MATKKSGKTTAKSAKTKTRAKAVKAELPIIKRARTASWLAILESVVIAVLGVLLVIHPEAVIKLIFYVVGIFLMVKGVYKVINYFAVHGKYDFYNNDLLYGIIALVFGILAVVLWEQLSGAIGLVVGAWMIYGALVRTNAAIKMHAAGVRSWFYALLMALLMLALGIYLVISMSTAGFVQVIGWVMVAAAVISVVDDVIFIKNLDAVKQ